MLNHLHIVQNWLEVCCILKLLYIHSLHIIIQIQNGSICVNQNQLKIWYRILIETCMFSFPHKMILYSKLSIIKYTFIEKKIIRFAIFLSGVYLLTTGMCIGNMVIWEDLRDHLTVRMVKNPRSSDIEFKMLNGTIVCIERLVFKKQKTGNEFWSDSAKKGNNNLSSNKDKEWMSFYNILWCTYLGMEFLSMVTFQKVFLNKTRTIVFCNEIWYMLLTHFEMVGFC